MNRHRHLASCCLLIGFISFASLLASGAKADPLPGRDLLKFSQKPMVATTVPDNNGTVGVYFGHDEHGTLYVASELKALAPVCVDAREFPPGHYWVSDEAEPTRYYVPTWTDYAAVADAEADRAVLRAAFEAAVKSHMMSDVPYGVLLSGGLDSSLVAAIAKKYAARRVEEDEKTEAWWPQLHSFAVGLRESPDLKAAREVAAHIGTVHHELHFTVQEGIDALSDVIYHLETYDVTTVRASTPMYLMARRIRAMGIKMVLSGEGSDELFGGYKTFDEVPRLAAVNRALSYAGPLRAAAVLGARISPSRRRP